MSNRIKKIALLTGGSDCPGINGAIRGITKAAILNYGYEVIGFTRGFVGLYDNEFISLDENKVSGILRNGGSILYNSNRSDLFQYKDPATGEMKDASDIAIENLKKNNVDALIVLGGNYSLTYAKLLQDRGVNVIGIPKTINNDIMGVHVTFGFNSALRVAVEALDRLHTTAESHHRIMVLEVMGKESGWLALEAGIGGDADIILIPEIPYDINKVADRVRKIKESGKLYTIIVTAEGAVTSNDSYSSSTIGGAGHRIADSLEKMIKGKEVRCTVLGHTQRGGETITYDRIIATQVGVRAVEDISNGRFGNILSVKGNDIVSVPLANINNESRFVDPQGELVHVAKSIGIYFGE